MSQPGPPPSGGDWAAQTAGTIERVVGTVRDKTTVPITTVARAVVYGIVAGAMGAVAVILLAVAAVRAFEVYVPYGDVWLPYLIVGGIFVLAGLFLWSKRRKKGSR